MRTPAGKECFFFYGDYYRGRDREECRLLNTAKPPLKWSPDLCSTCPVPEILTNNSCQFLILEPSIGRPFPFTRRQVKVRPVCSKSGRIGFDPNTGCGECISLPPIFSGEPFETDSSD
jgi:hypothetical protein